MRKALLLLSGLILLGLLSYIGYIDKSPTIKNDLISKTDNAYKDKNISGIKVSVKGQDLAMTRVLVLTGSVLTEEKRSEAGDIANSIKGVKYIDNQITIMEEKKIEEKKVVVKKEVIIEKKINIEKEVVVKEEVIIKKETIVEPKVIIEKKPIENISIEKENIKKEIIEKKIIENIEKKDIKTIIPVAVAPIAIPKTVEVPIPVKAVTAPVAIQLEEQSKEIPSNTKGVE